jgi:hypothetical protein
MIAPLAPVQPFMGLDHILMSFFVLVVGGLGSVGGLLTGSAVIGGTNSIVSALSDSTGGYFCVLVLSILFLWLRPRASMRAASIALSRCCWCPSWRRLLGLPDGPAVPLRHRRAGRRLCWGRVASCRSGRDSSSGLSAVPVGPGPDRVQREPRLCCLVRWPRWRPASSPS